MKTFPIMIADKKYSSEFQSLPEFSKGWRTVLTDAHGGFANCLCLPFNPDLRKVSIKYQRSSDIFHLARFKETEDQHDPECRFAQTYEERLQPAEPELDPTTAIRKTASGVAVSFHLGISTAKKTQSGTASTSTVTPRKQRLTVKSLSLLHLIWDQAGLNVWLPSFAGKRNYFTAFYRVHSASKTILVNNVPLSNVLLLQTTEKNELASEQNKSITSNAVLNQQKLFVIAKLARFKPEQHTPHPNNLPLAGFFGMPWIDVSAPLWQRTEANQQSAYESWKSGCDVIAIALIEAQSATYSRALEIALMPVSAELLPLEK